MLSSFVVWRESREARLVLAIRLAWVAEQLKATRLRHPIDLAA